MRKWYSEEETHDLIDNLECMGIVEHERFETRNSVKFNYRITDKIVELENKVEDQEQMIDKLKCCGNCKQKSLHPEIDYVIVCDITSEKTDSYNVCNEWEQE